MSKITLNILFVLITYTICAQIHNQSQITQARFTSNDNDNTVTNWLKSPGAIKVLILNPRVNQQDKVTNFIAGLIKQFGSKVEFRNLFPGTNMNLQRFLNDNNKKVVKGATVYLVYKNGQEVDKIEELYDILKEVLETLTR